MKIKTLGNQQNDKYHIAHFEDTTSDETHTIISELFGGINSLLMLQFIIDC